MKDKILLFIPAYNCEKQITRVLEQIDNEVMKYITEIIIVNNLSTDETVNVAINYLKHNSLPCKIISNDRNYNLGGSHKVAFDYAIQNEFDAVVVLHGDDQADIHDFIPIFQNSQINKYDCILGSRFMKGSKLIGYSKKRILGNHVFNAFFSIVLGKRVNDLGSGLNMYNSRMLNEPYYLKYPDALYFNDFMLMASCYYKHSILFYPISWREDDQTSNNKLLQFSFSLLKMLLSYMFNKKNLLDSDLRTTKIEKYTYQIEYECNFVQQN